MSDPRYSDAIAQLFAISQYFGGVWIPIDNDNGYKKIADIIRDIAELLGEYDDLYIQMQNMKNKGESNEEDHRSLD